MGGGIARGRPFSGHDRREGRIVAGASAGLQEAQQRDARGEQQQRLLRPLLTTLISEQRHKMSLFSLKCLDPGSGRKIPAIWHGAGANPGVYPRNLVLRMASFVLWF